MIGRIAVAGPRIVLHSRKSGPAAIPGPGHGSAGAAGSFGGAQAVSTPAAPPRPNSVIVTSRILYFCTLPVTVIGKSSEIRR
jgi:hypothetical protein